MSGISSQLPPSISTVINDTLLDEKQLIEIVSSSEGRKRERTAEDVKLPYYENLMFYRGKNDEGIPQFFQAWTLIVVWNDDTMDCWVNALDVAKGLGYTSDNLSKNIYTFISGSDRFVNWNDISKLYFAPMMNQDVTSDVEVRSPCWWGEKGYACGLEHAKKNRGNTVFLTEEGLYEVYQFSPKCKSFRRSVANILKHLRQKLRRNQEDDVAISVKDAVEKERQRLAAITDAANAEKDREIAELRDTLTRTKQEYNEQMDKLKKDHEQTIQRMRHQVEAKTMEITDLYQHRSLLEDELKTLRDEVAERTAELHRVSEELNRAKEQRDAIRVEADQLFETAAKKRTQLEQFHRAFRAVRKVYANPRNVSLVDGTFAIAKEPCVFFTYFGKVLVPETPNSKKGEWRDGFCVLRRQRRGLASEAKYMFNAYDAENGGTNYRVNPSYRTMGVLSQLCQPRLAQVENFELPDGYRPQHFLMPTRDFKLNSNDRFLLLNTVNAVSFMNMIIDNLETVERYQDTDDDNSDEEDGEKECDDNDSLKRSKNCNGKQKMVRHLYTRKRVDESSIDNSSESQQDPEHRDHHQKEKDKAKRTTRLIQRIVRRNPSLTLALTLKRYRYRLPYDPTAGELTSPAAPGIDLAEMRRSLGSSNQTMTASTIYYSTNPTATGVQVLNAISMLWQELISALEEESSDSMQAEIDNLLKMFDL
jgi:hypothetical protein